MIGHCILNVVCRVLLLLLLFFLTCHALCRVHIHSITISDFYCTVWHFTKSMTVLFSLISFNFSFFCVVRLLPLRPLLLCAYCFCLFCHFLSSSQLPNVKQIIFLHINTHTHVISPFNRTQIRTTAHNLSDFRVRKNKWKIYENKKYLWVDTAQRAHTTQKKTHHYHHNHHRVNETN